MAQTGDLKTLPLDDLHRQAGARFGPFAGWSMPLTYADGVMKEHLHTREKAGLFDISHMKLFLVSGAGAAAALATACPFDPEALGNGQSKYTFFLNDNAGIIDDLIVTRLGADRFMGVANAGNAEIDQRHLEQMRVDTAWTLAPLNRVFLALQGPAAEAVLRDAGLDLSQLSFMQGCEPRESWFASRSGYTGEDGFEIALPVDEADAFATALLADKRVQWIGLAARDSLRLEAGLCLHGQDITADTSPVDAGLMWAIPKALREKGSFIGADALRAELARGRARSRGRHQARRAASRCGRGRCFSMRAARRSATSPRAVSAPRRAFPSPWATSPAMPRPVAPSSPMCAASACRSEIHALPFTPHRYRKG